MSKKNKWEALYNKFFGPNWIRIPSSIIGVVGLCTGLFETISLFGKCFQNQYKEICILAIFDFIVIILLVGMALWYELHVSVQVQKAKDKIEEQFNTNLGLVTKDLQDAKIFGQKFAQYAHSSIEEFRNIYISNGDLQRFLSNIYTTIIEPAMRSSTGGEEGGFDCSIKIVGRSGQLKSVFRNRPERKLIDPENVEKNFIFEHFKNKNQDSQKYIIMSSVEKDLKDIGSATNNELLKRAKEHNYTSIFAIPLIIRFADKVIEKSKLTISDTKTMIGFIGFDSKKEGYFDALKQWDAQNRNTYGYLNFFFFIADLIACACYQCDIEGVRSAISTAEL